MLILTMATNGVSDAPVDPCLATVSTKGALWIFAVLVEDIETEVNKTGGWQGTM